jgi:hypothetical protein
MTIEIEAHTSQVKCSMKSLSRTLHFWVLRSCSIYDPRIFQPLLKPLMASIRVA